MYEFKSTGEFDELQTWGTASSEEEKTPMLKRLASEFDFIDTWEVFKNGEHVETVQAQSLLAKERAQYNEAVAEILMEHAWMEHAKMTTRWMK